MSAPSELNSSSATSPRRSSAPPARKRIGSPASRGIVCGNGKLVEPANDSAAFYLSALQAADANNAYVAAGSRELATKLLDRASAYSREGKTAQMDADLAQARSWGADAKDIQAVQQASLEPQELGQAGRRERWFSHVGGGPAGDD